MKKNILKRALISAVVAVIAVSCLISLCACNKNTAERYEVNKEDTFIMGYGGNFMLSLIFEVAFDKENTYLELDDKGNMHFQIRTKAGLFGEGLDALLNTLSNFGLDGLSKDGIAQMLSTFDIEGGVNSMVEPMFPGFRAKLEKGDLDGALKLIQRSLGFYLYGLDYSNADIQNALKYVGENMKLPSNLLEILPADTQLTLTFDNKYYKGEVEGADGSKYEAIFIGEISENPYTQPFGIFTVTKNENGKKVMTLNIEFMNVQLSFIQA